MEKNNRGFTLLELLIVLLIFLIVGGVIFYIVVRTLNVFSTTGSSLKKTVEVLINTDVLTFDIKHAGYGISSNETQLVISYCNGNYSPLNPACKAASIVNGSYYPNGPIDNKLLLLRETVNIVRSQNAYPSAGFILANGTPILSEPPNATDAPECVWLGSNKQLLSSSSGCSSGPTGILSTGFPISVPDACQNPSNVLCCSNQKCSSIMYYLQNDTESSTKAKYCINGTFSFIREVPDNTGNLNNTVLHHLRTLQCVTDWNTWFGLDGNNDTVVDRWVNEIPYTDPTATPSMNLTVINNDDLRTKLIMMKIYLLVQASTGADPKYNFCLYANCTANNTEIVVDTLVAGSSVTPVTLKTPKARTGNDNWIHYHWKIIQINTYYFPDIP